MKLSKPFHNLLLVVMLLLLLPAPATSAAAQAEAAFSVVLVDVWPEYDQPSVLVMYHMTLAPTVSLPATISVRIPAAAGVPHAVAMQDVAGLYDLNYDLRAAEEWIEVRFTTPVPDVRIEYYDPLLQKDGAQRSYTYRWPANYSVQTLSIRVQQPLNASNMSFRPDIGAGLPDADGLTYYTLEAGQVNAGSAFDLSLSYEKANDALTNPQQFQQAQPSQPIDAGTPGRSTIIEGLVMTVPQLVMLGLGLALIVGGVAWFMLTNRAGGAANRRSKRRRHARAAAGGQAALAEEDDEPVFCHKCGKRSGPGDVFCRACGTELR